MEMTSYPPGTPAWVDIGVPDIDAAVDFYGAVFGWSFDEGSPETGGYRQALLRGTPVAGFGPQMNPGPPVWATYIAVDDVEATTAAVEAAGGTVLLPAMDVMDFGRMAVFTDDVGTAFSVWQAGTHIGCGIVNEPNSLSWNELTVREPDQAKAFYGAVFGWGFHDNPMGEFDYTEWNLDDRTIGGMMPMVGPMWDGIPNHWMVYFAVDDTDAACERVKAAGGNVDVDPFDIPAGRIAVVSDTAGAHFTVITLAEGMG